VLVLVRGSSLVRPAMEPRGPITDKLQDKPLHTASQATAIANSESLLEASVLVTCLVHQIHVCPSSRDLGRCTYWSWPFSSTNRRTMSKTR